LRRSRTLILDPTPLGLGCGAWIKTKCLNRAEFVVVGWSDPEGSRPYVGALLLGYYESDGRLVWLRAIGVIGRDTKTTTIRFDDDSEFVVEVTSKGFSRCGGDWSMFRCHCGRRCQKLRLFEGRPTCASCIRATGMRYRIEMFSHANTARAQRRGWLTSASAGAEVSVAVAPRTITFRWRQDGDPDPGDDFGAGKLIEHAPDKD
jgi:hypothetical protein